MEKVYVVVGIGCTPQVMAFDNQEACLVAKAAFEESYDRVYTYELDVLEGFSKYSCPNCGCNTFVLTWNLNLEARISYDPNYDEFDLDRQTDPDDVEPEDVEVRCYDCDRYIEDLNGDLMERLWGEVR